MLIFPDPNLETEYTDPNGSVWRHNNTGWVRQCDCDGPGGGGDNGSGDPYWDHVKCQMQFEGDFSSDVGATAYTLEKDSNAAVTTDKAKHGLFSMESDSQQSGITTKFKDNDFFNSAWTVEVWFRPQTTAGTGQAKLWLMGMDDGNGTTNYRGWRVWQSERNLQFQYRNGSSNSTNEITPSSFAMPNNSFSHIAVTYDGGSHRVFINGKLAVTRVHTGNPSTFADFKLGGRHTADWGSANNPNASGHFDDLRVTTACRYTADFEPPGELPQSAFVYADREVTEPDEPTVNISNDSGDDQ